GESRDPVNLVTAPIGGAAVDIDVPNTAIVTNFAVPAQIGAIAIAVVAITALIIAVVTAVARAGHAIDLQAIGFAIDPGDTLHSAAGGIALVITLAIAIALIVAITLVVALIAIAI